VPRARVELRLSEDCSCLTLAIADNGNSGAEWVPGIGLTSMSDRASELGGTVAWHPTPTGSTVTVDLPLGTPHGTAAHGD